MTALWSRGYPGFGSSTDEQHHASHTEQDGDVEYYASGVSRESDRSYEIDMYAAGDVGDGWGDGRPSSAWIINSNDDGVYCATLDHQAQGSHDEWYEEESYWVSNTVYRHDEKGFPEQDIDQPHVALTRLAALEFFRVRVADAVAIADGSIHVFKKAQP